MNNIFKNSYFGKPYKTREGNKKALYIHKRGKNDPYHKLIFEDGSEKYYLEDGSFLINKNEHPLDIVSEWQESTNENELENLAEDYADNCLPQGEDSFGDESWCYLDVKEAYKAGYRKANQNKHIAIIAAIEHLVDNDLIK